LASSAARFPSARSVGASSNDDVGGIAGKLLATGFAAGLATVGEKKEDDAALANCCSRVNFAKVVSVEPLGAANATWAEGDQVAVVPKGTDGLAADGEEGSGGLADGGKSALCM